MADQFQNPGIISQIISRLRGVKSGGPGPQMDGYRLYVEEQRANGIQPVSYNEWIQQQGSLSSPQQ